MQKAVGRDMSSPNSVQSSQKNAYTWFCLRESKTVVEFHNFIPKLVTFADAKRKHKIKSDES